MRIVIDRDEESSLIILGLCKIADPPLVSNKRANDPNCKLRSPGKTVYKRP